MNVFSSFQAEASHFSICLLNYFVISNRTAPLENRSVTRRVSISYYIEMQFRRNEEVNEENNSLNKKFCEGYDISISSCEFK